VGVGGRSTPTHIFLKDKIKIEEINELYQIIIKIKNIFLNKKFSEELIAYFP
jgi:hypothetical protein